MQEEIVRLEDAGVGAIRSTIITTTDSPSGRVNLRIVIDLALLFMCCLGIVHLLRQSCETL